MRRGTALAAVALMLLGAPIANADAEDTGGPTMPDLRGGTLAQARDTIAELDAGFPLEVDSINISGYPQKQRAPKMWKVCSQLPKPGTALTPKTYIAVGVVRKGEECS